MSFADAAETMELLCFGAGRLGLVARLGDPNVGGFIFSKTTSALRPLMSPVVGPRPKLGQKPSALNFGSALPALPVAAPETPETFTLPGANPWCQRTLRQADHTMGQAFRSRALGWFPEGWWRRSAAQCFWGSSPLGKSLQSCPVGASGEFGAGALGYESCLSRTLAIPLGSPCNCHTGYCLGDVGMVPNPTVSAPEAAWLAPWGFRDRSAAHDLPPSVGELVHRSCWHWRHWSGQGGHLRLQPFFRST